MAGAHPQAVPTTRIVCTAVTPHRHVEADRCDRQRGGEPGGYCRRTGDSAGVRGPDCGPAASARAAQSPPTHPGSTQNRWHRKGWSAPEKRATVSPRCPTPLQRRAGYPPEPGNERSSDIQPLEDQEDAQDNDNQPDDLEPVSSQKPAQLALMMAMLHASGVLTDSSDANVLTIRATHRKANSRALVDSDAQAYSGPGITPSSSVRKAVTPSTTCSGTPTLTRSPSSSAGTKNM